MKLLIPMFNFVAGQPVKLIFIFNIFHQEPLPYFVSILLPFSDDIEILPKKYDYKIMLKNRKNSSFNNVLWELTTHPQ